MSVVKRLFHPLLGALEVCIFGEDSGTGVAIDISRLLTSCASMLSELKGGHVPNVIVEERILRYYTSVESVRNLSDQIACRFYITHGCTVLATALVARAPGVLMPEQTHGGHSQLSRSIQGASIKGRFHSIFNVAVRQDSRNLGLARILINVILEYGRANFAGEGIYLRSEPPEHDIWSKLGFVHVMEIDEFFEGPISPSVIFENVSDYNEKFTCRCQKSENWLKRASTMKLKYFSFILNF